MREDMLRVVAQFFHALLEERGRGVRERGRRPFALRFEEEGEGICSVDRRTKVLVAGSCGEGWKRDTPNHSSVHHRVLNPSTRRHVRTDFPWAFYAREEGCRVVLESLGLPFGSRFLDLLKWGSKVGPVGEDALGVGRLVNGHCEARSVSI